MLAERPEQLTPSPPSPVPDALSVLQQIRAAYAAGESPLAEHLTCEALNQGLSWHQVADAAARGIADRGTPTASGALPGALGRADRAVRPRRRLIPSPPAPGRRLSLLLNVLLFLLLYPILQTLHEGVVIAVAIGLAYVGSLIAAFDALAHLPFDPIYSAMAVQSLTGLEPLGLAVRGWPATLLQSLQPGWFVESDPVGAPLVEAVFGRGSPIMGVGLSRFAADVAVLGLGLWLVLRTRGLRLLGWLILLDSSLRVVRFPPLLEDLEAAGLSFVLYALAPHATSREVALSDLAAVYPRPLVDLALGLLALAAAQLCLWGPLLSWRFLRWLRSAPSPRGGWLALRRTAPVFTGVLVVALVGLANTWAWPAPMAAEVDDAPPLPALSTPLPPVASESPPRPQSKVSSSEPASPAPLPPAAEAWKPSVVRVAGGPNVFSYTVNGRPEIVRGIGYNPMLAGLPAPERRAILERDFALMRYAHINTVTGWDDREFDRLLLDVAHQYGLGVLMPFPFSPADDYTSPEVREYLRNRVHAWVRRYKDHPSVRMWGLSNELLHKLIHPSWMAAKNDPEKQRRADAFADLFVQLADDLREIDPNHPVIIRQAEESFVGPILRALERNPKPRPYVIWGGNFYNQRLGKALAWWEKDGPRHALLVSEFAEGGVSQADRPRGYQVLWNLIRARPSFVIGGAPYVWYTHGPEEVDRVFGMVGPDGKPVGGSLEAIRQMYMEDESRMRQQESE